MSRSRPVECVMGRPCPEHGFVHGAEAEELRKGIEVVPGDRALREAAPVAGPERGARAPVKGGAVRKPAKKKPITQAEKHRRAERKRIAKFIEGIAIGVPWDLFGNDDRAAKALRWASDRWSRAIRDGEYR